MIKRGRPTVRKEGYICFTTWLMPEMYEPLISIRDFFKKQLKRQSISVNEIVQIGLRYVLKHPEYLEKQLRKNK
jgi:hypothetical protein